MTFLIIYKKSYQKVSLITFLIIHKKSYQKIPLIIHMIIYKKSYQKISPITYLIIHKKSYQKMVMIHQNIIKMKIKMAIIYQKVCKITSQNIYLKIRRLLQGLLINLIKSLCFGHLK